MKNAGSGSSNGLPSRQVLGSPVLGSPALGSPVLGPRVLGALGVALVGISSAALFVRFAAPLDHAVIACLRVGTTGVVLFLLGPRSLWLALLKCRDSLRTALTVALASFLLAGNFASWIASLELTSVIVSVTLVSTQPLFAAVLGRLLGDRAPGQVYAGALIAIFGSMLMVGTEAPSSAPSHSLGAGLALLGAVTAAGYLLLGRGLRSELPFAGYFALVNLGAFLFLGLHVMLRGAPLAPPEATLSDYLAVVYLGLVPGVLGHGLLNWTVRRVAVHVVSLAAVLEPVGATLLAWSILGETASGSEIVGGVVLLSGVCLGLFRRTRGAEAPGARSARAP